MSASLVLSQYPPELAAAPQRNSASPVGRKSGAKSQPPFQLAMSQSHGVLVTTQLPPASAITSLADIRFRFSLIPSAAALDCSALISSVTQSPCALPGA